jgi:AcrR family transcriptional regulator
MNTSRAYTMTARARSMEQTRGRILDATVDLHSERLATEIGLEQIAERAGVSVQTVLRHFGSRDRLVEAALAHAMASVEDERRTPVGDPDAAVHVIVDHYETRGDGVLLMLAQEQSHELMRTVTESGRRMHRAWVEEVFAPYVGRGGADAATLTDLLVVATDVYTWKLLRRDRGLSRQQTESRMRALVGAVLATHP